MRPFGTGSLSFGRWSLTLFLRGLAPPFFGGGGGFRYLLFDEGRLSSLEGVLASLAEEVEAALLWLAEEVVRRPSLVEEEVVLTSRP